MSNEITKSDIRDGMHICVFESGLTTLGFSAYGSNFFSSQHVHLSPSQAATLLEMMKEAVPCAAAAAEKAT